jgi:DNA-binding HxlR family transcriptional regulator
MTKINTDSSKYCPIIKPTKLVGDVWNILIIKCLLNGPRRFNQIKTEIPEITSRTLTCRLKELVEQGIIERKQYPVIPPKVEYTLTEKGQGLRNVIEAIEEFGNKYLC